MDTHFARTGGALVSTDATPPFQPNVTKSSVALKSAVEGAARPGFQQEYNHRRQMFLASNTTDSHQDTRSGTPSKGRSPRCTSPGSDTRTPGTRPFPGATARP